MSSLLSAMALAAAMSNADPAHAAGPSHEGVAAFSDAESLPPRGERAGLDPIEVRATPEHLDPRWRYAGFYFVTGVAPGTTLQLHGLNPMVRYDVELGLEWQREKWAVSFGAEPWLLQYFERNDVGGGVMGVVTISRRPVYVRLGAGSLIGIPGSTDDDDVRSAVGVLAGMGVQGGSASCTGRFGVDYHVALDKAGRLDNTVMLSLRLKFG